MHIAILVITSQRLDLLIPITHEGTESAARGAADGVTERLGDFFERRAERTEASV